MALPPGTRLDSYEIQSLLGAGGMGEVYRARDRTLGRSVAIKVLPANIAADPQRRARFEQEAYAASSLNHPNIVTIHGLGSTPEAALYVAMELVEGRTLRELLRKGALTNKKVLDLAVQTAEGLAKAHGAGVVHRDLKPENLIVSDDGFAKIVDFGLAKLRATPEELSHLPTLPQAGDQPGDGPGYRRVHVSGTGRGQERGFPLRPVLAGDDPLRDGVGPTPLPWGHVGGDLGRDHA